MNMGFKTPETSLVMVSMIVSEVRMFLKQTNYTNTLVFFNFVLENTHKYHKNYSINTLKFLCEFGIQEIFFLITQLKSL